MTTMQRFWVPAIVLALAATPAMADGMAMQGARPSSHSSKAGAGYAKAFAASTQTMMNNMTMTSTGDPDLDFATMMLPHHQGAIDMARVELRYGKDPGMRKLAAAIVNAQEREIAAMSAWKAAHAKSERRGR